MLATKHQKLEEYLVKLLSYTPNQTVGELQKRLRKEIKKKVTPQGVYRALSKLSTEGVVVKEGKQYALNVSWIVDILRLSETMKHSYISKEKVQVIRLPQKKGEKVRFKFRNLLTTNRFWAHILVHIGSLYSEERNLWAYNPHFWFYLAHEDIEKQYDRSMQEVGVHTNLIIGSNSFLDTWSARFFDSSSVTHWLSPKPIYPDQIRYLNLLGEYFIEVKIGKEVAEKMDRLFREVQSLEEVSHLKLIEIFQEKSVCTMIVTKHSPKARAFKKKIQKHFV